MDIGACRKILETEVTRLDLTVGTSELASHVGESLTGSGGKRSKKQKRDLGTSFDQVPSTSTFTRSAETKIGIWNLKI